MNPLTLVAASQLGAILDCDINTGLQLETGGKPTNNDAILNAFLALGVESSPVCLVMDGCTVTGGIVLPAGGHASIEGCGWDTGFYLATGTNRDVINNGGSALAIPSDPGYSSPPVPTPTSRGSNVTLRDFRINGNSAGNSGPYPADYFPMGINLMNLNNCLIENVWIDNTAKYNLRFSNCGWCTVRGYRVTSTGAYNTDGIHVSGPGNNFIFDGCDIESGDDMIALNAPEGYCGSIFGVTVSNVRGYGNSFIRAYTASSFFPHQLSITNVVVTNCTVVVSPTHANAVFLIGYQVSGAADAIRDLTVSNCTFSMTPGIPIVSLRDNVGTLKFSNCVWIAPVDEQPWVRGDLAGVAISVAEFTGCSIYLTPDGSVPAYLLGNARVGTLVLNSFAIANQQGRNYAKPVNLIVGCTIAAVTGPGVLATGYPFADAEMANGTPYLSATSGNPSIKIGGVVKTFTTS